MLIRINAAIAIALYLALLVAAQDVHRDTPPDEPAGDAVSDAASVADVDWGACRDCHVLPGDALPPLSTFRPAMLAAELADCGACHDEAGLSLWRSTWAHPVRPPGSHLPCATCHDALPHSADAPPPVLPGDYDEDACYECHPAVDVARSAMWAHGDNPRITCRACHPPHTPLSAALPAALVAAEWREAYTGGYDWWLSNQLCLGCHPAGELLFGLDRGFATLNTVNYHDVHVMRGRVLCLECHDPHGGNRRAMVRGRLLSGEVLGYMDNFDGGSCTVICHGINHDAWQYINAVY
jgi:hypothetical protein